MAHYSSFLRCFGAASALIFSIGCGDDGASGEAPRRDGGSPSGHSGAGRDGGGGPDGPRRDGGGSEAGRDGGLLACEGGASCEEPNGEPDSGAPDPGDPDSGKPDSGEPDAGERDSGTPLECGALTRCGNECVDLDTSSAHCGSCGHSCYGAACMDAKCQPEHVVTVSGGFAMAVGQDYLFFTSVSSGVVKRSGKTKGSSVSELFDVAADSETSSIAKPIIADAAHVFVGTTQAGVRRAPVGGGASTALNQNRSDTMLAMNATDLAYVYDDIVAGKKKVVRLKKDGTGTYDLLHEVPYAIGALSVGSDVFWANSNGNGTYNIQRKVGVSVVNVVQNEAYLEGLYEIGSHLYWSSDVPQEAFTIRRAALDGSGQVDLVVRPRETADHYFLADADGLYWVDLTTHGLSLFRATLEGADAREVAPSVGMLRTLASDATHLYWMKQAGEVWRLAK